MAFIIDENGNYIPVLGETGGGGGGSYTLPVATTEVLGGVKIDGTTININENGVISSSPQYTLPTATTEVLGGVKIDGTSIGIDDGIISLNNYVPSTVQVVVASDGSGDFTTLSAALSYLNGKWSNHAVTITVNPGTYTENTTVSITKNYPNLIIQGTKNACIINNLRLNVWEGSKVWVKALNFVQADDSNLGPAFDVANAFLEIQNCSFTVPGTCVASYNDAQVRIDSGNTIEKSSTFALASSGNINLQYNASITIKNTATAFNVSDGGIIRAIKTTLSLTNVSSKTNIPVNTWRAEGFICLND